MLPRALFCISSKLSTLDVIALDYTVALYPLVLSALIYLMIEVHDRGCLPLVWLWMPFHICLFRFRRKWDIKGSIINAFATLYVLSFTKVISTCVNIMLTTHTVNVCGEHSWSKLYYDASCSIFQRCHRPVALITLAVAVMFIILPSLFIFLHPCKLFNKCKFSQCHLLQLMNEIATIFQHSFKNGINSTVDCRWFAGIYLLLRITIATSVNWRTPQQIQVISSIAGVMLIAVFQPHTRTLYNVLDSFLFAGLGIIFILLPAGQSRHITQVLILCLSQLSSFAGKK